MDAMEVSSTPIRSPIPEYDHFYKSLAGCDPHHLVRLHSQLDFIITVLFTFAVGTLDFLQVFHSFLR